MAHYNANQIIENIERVLDEEGASEGAEPGSKVSRFRERRAEEMQPSTFRKLERGTFKAMRVHQAVDKVPEGSRFRLFKKIFARLLRMVSAPQATYNYQNLQALQLISNEIDALRDRVRSAENRDMVPFGMAQLEGSGSTRLSNLVTQHLEQVQRNVGGITNNMQEMSQSLSLVLDNLSAVSNRLNQLGVTQKDLYTEVSGARLDASRLWTELGLVYESIDTRAEDLWKGLDERDLQLVKNTEAAQSLHNQVSSLDTTIKELRARLMVLTEQLTIHQEMIETVQQEVKEAPRSERAPRPAPSTDAVPAAEPPPTVSIQHTPGVSPTADAAGTYIQRQLDLAYLRFQRQYRGDEAELRARQKEYITLLTANLKRDASAGKPRLLDVACGDGIFVELAAESGWDAKGVDINEIMVKQGRQRGLSLDHDDAFVYLERQEPKSLDVLSMFQFVEHLPPAMIMRVLKLGHRALRPNGLLLVETINPHTLKALHWFHLDLTHERLIFPEMLQLMSETTGFFSIEWKGINPVAETERLKSEGTETERANLRKLNELLYGPQDYYFLGRRPSGEGVM